MKNNVWAKTILSVYKYLDRVAGAIDKLVKQEAVNSFYYNGVSKNRNGTLDVANRIIDMSARKVRLVNIKVLADKALCECDRGSAQILIQKYMDGDGSQEIAERNNLNIRTYFRHLINAEEKFSSILAKEGFDDKKLCNYLAGEKWIMEVYYNLKNAEKENDEGCQELG